MFVYSEAVLGKIAERLERHCMLETAGPIGVAVSGGADSVGLLYALRELYPGRAFRVVHVNHCLRGPESDADERFVRRLGERLGCGCYVRRADVAAMAAARGGNVEQAGRRCRYGFFRELLETVKVASLGQITDALFAVGGRYRRSM